MRTDLCLWLAALGCLAVTGCGSAEIAELTARVQKLEAENAQLQAKLQATQQQRDEQQAQLDQLQGQVAQFQEIQKGYEEARVKLQQKIKVLAPLLGIAGDFSSLPPAFEQLKNSDWADAPLPGAGDGLGDLDALLNELKNLPGDQTNPPQP